MEVHAGPSNGKEEVANLTRPDGSALSNRGYAVVMDNCSFHHGLFVEPILADLIAGCGVRLIFQAPHSTEFNTCELNVSTILKRSCDQEPALSGGKNSLCSV